MKNKLVVCICFFLILIRLFCEKSEIDSIRSILDDTSGTEHIDLLIVLTNLQRKDDNAAALITAEQALREAEKINYTFGQGKVNQTIADIYYDIRENEKAEEYYKKSITYFSILDYKSSLAYCYHALGSLYLRLTDYEKAISNLLDAVNCYTEIGNKNKTHNTLNNLGVVYKEIGNNEKALEYFLDALEISRENNDKKAICQNLNNIGTIYNNLQKDTLALDYYKKSLKLSMELNFLPNIAQCYNNIGNIYSENSNYNEALDFYLKALKIKKKIGDKEAIFYPLVNIGNVYAARGDFQKAEKYITQALEISLELKLKELSCEAYLSLSKVYEGMNLYKKSLANFQLYSANKDSIINEEISEKISHIEAKFETEKKEKEIEIYKLQLEKRKLVEWRLYFIILIVIALMLILYVFYTLKNRSNKLLKNEISEKIKAEEGLQEARNELELKVKERTAELAETNKELQLEIKDHKTAEEMYRKYESIANTSREFMTLINKNFIYEAVNDSYCQATNKNFEEIIGNSVSMIWGKKQFEKTIKPYLDKCFAGNEVHYREWFNFSDSEKRFYDVAYYPYYDQNERVTHTIVVTRDITEQKLLENQLLRSERLAGVGELAAGVAHEIRNPVAIINSTAQFCRNKYKKNDTELNELMEIFTETAEKIDKTVKNLLEFAKPQKIEMKKSDILEVLKKVCGLIEGKCSEQNVEAIYTFPDSLPYIFLDEDQLSGAFLNLMLNALDAMQNGGQIKVQAESNKEEIKITISDTGTGISQENLSKIFNPFFTTKNSGTGLGLSLVHQIIGFHKGKINISSKIGEGTEVTLKFPVYE